MPIIKSTRRRGGKWHTAEQSTAPPWVMPQPAPAKPQRPRVELPPGATMTRDEYRQKDTGDLRPALYWASVLGTGAGALIGLAVSVDANAIVSVRAGGIAGAAVFFVAFLTATYKTVWKDGSTIKTLAERITRRDLDGDGVVGESEPQRHLITIHVEDGNTHRYLNDIALTPELQSFARGVVDGSVTFSERGARGVDHGAFVELRDQLLDRGMIAWKNEHSPQAGYHIRPLARRALGELARLPLPRGVHR